MPSTVPLEQGFSAPCSPAGPQSFLPPKSSTGTSEQEPAASAHKGCEPGPSETALKSMFLEIRAYKSQTFHAQIAVFALFHRHNCFYPCLKTVQESSAEMQQHLTHHAEESCCRQSQERQEDTMDSWHKETLNYVAGHQAAER